jgi:arylformamidase
MCEVSPGTTPGWQGWLNLPSTTTGRPIGPWLDCSWEVDDGMPCIATLPRPRVSRLKEIPKDPFNATHLDLVVHSGTHVDAPVHFFADAPAFHEIPLDRLIGPGVVWRLDKEPDSMIEVADLVNARPQLRPGDIVVLDTAWARHYPGELFGKHPCLSVDAAEWLVAQQVKMVAIDFATPDLPLHRRPPSGFNWPVHRSLLSRGVLICEQIRPPTELLGKRVELMFAALNIRQSDGSPTRVIARQVEA